MNDRNHINKDMTEAERRISNLVLMGQITDIDSAQARVKVAAGAITTTWIPFATARAGHDRTWHMPEIGEQVIVACPCGDINQGVVVGSVYREAHPAPADTPEISRSTYKDGASIEYNREGHTYFMDVPAGGHIRLKIGKTTLELRDDGSTLTTPELLVDCPQSRFTGHVEIAKGLTVYNPDGTSTAEIVGDIAHRDGDYTLTGGDVNADGIGLKPHKHMEQGDGQVTSAAVG